MFVLALAQCRPDTYLARALVVLSKRTVRSFRFICTLEKNGYRLSERAHSFTIWRTQ